jgi:hypothetical protein
MNDSNSQMPFGDALVTAIRGLKGQPPLLVVVAMAVILATVAIASTDAARTIALPLLALVGAGLVAWVYTDARRVQHDKPGVFQNTHLGRWSRQEDLTIKTGPVEAGRGGRVEQNFEAGAGSKQKNVKIEHGEVRSKRR